MPKRRRSASLDNFTPEEIDFMLAMDRYKRRHQRPFPTCSEVLAVLVSLGYRKVDEACQLPEPPKSKYANKTKDSRGS